MPWQSTSYVLLLFLSALVASIWAGYGIVSVPRERRNRTVTTFVVLCLSAAVWAVTYGIQLASTGLEAKLFAYRVLHVGGAATPSAWLAFALAYSGRGDRLTPIVVTALTAIPAVVVVLLVANPYSLVLVDAELVTIGSLTRLETTLGPAYQAHLAFSYVAVVGGAGLVVDHALRSGGRIRRQAALLIVGATVPLALNVFEVLSLPPFGTTAVNLTPVSISLSTACFGVAVFRYRLLDLTPIASRVVLSEMDDGVVVVDAGGTIVDVNPAAEAVVGDRTTAIGASISARLPEYDRLETEAGASVLVTRDGTDGERFLRLSQSPLRRNSETYGRVVLIGDVTTIEEQRRALEERNERLDAFAGIVSHDLRNPLSVIGGYADLASETNDPEHFEVIGDTVDRMTEFLEDLLQLSRRGEVVTVVEPVRLRAILETVETDIADDDLTVVVDDAVDETSVLADPARLRQVLDNVLRNARDHADGPVTVAAGRLSDGFYLADDGPGIPESERESVFDVGFTTRGSGTGLGLAIVRDVVEAHGWSIEVVEGGEGGARFEITGVEFGEAGTAEEPTGSPVDSS
ncbi:PAS domain-containing sensor histidine kinase [Halorubrum sp. 48-1-W]|uniref:histidine kinase N-terminal 7TM domain-containing protein n=1 Tax=Halorubrum sp. 48-1-W TaxID=2249761 RepID=UPI000DCDC9EB|nr:histidine kinase N-terminal 7TM domain-containing protein [Halorubrum sp. 48-1-W]RAW45532.1 PAS domain-containing sensor histidine kinase [Halorubrum sp. 48-1-W]